MQTDRLKCFQYLLPLTHFSQNLWIPKLKKNLGEKNHHFYVEYSMSVCKILLCLASGGTIVFWVVPSNSMDRAAWRMGRGVAEVGSQTRELKMMSFFEDALSLLLPAPWPWGPLLHFLSKLAQTGTQWLCPIFSDCIWQASSNRVTRRNNLASFFLCCFGQLPPGLVICVLCILEWPHWVPRSHLWLI